MANAITDFNQFAAMRVAADNKDPAVLREVAGQFEALFIQQLLKNMREASLGDPLFGNSDQHDMYQEMMDQQMAVEMASGKGIGLADMLVRQLGGNEAPAASHNATSAWADARECAAEVWPHAKRLGRARSGRPGGQHQFQPFRHQGRKQLVG